MSTNEASARLNKSSLVESLNCLTSLDLTSPFLDPNHGADFSSWLDVRLSECFEAHKMVHFGFTNSLLCVAGAFLRVKRSQHFHNSSRGSSSNPTSPMILSSSCANHPDFKLPCQQTSCASQTVASVLEPLLRSS